MDWYASEILDGLTKLMSLSLDRTPAADSVQITAATWIDGTTVGRVWDQARDTPRIRAAFVTLANTREAWPAPKHFLDALPRVEQRAMGYEVKPLSPAEAEQRMAELRKMLDAPLSDEEQRAVPRKWQPTTDTAATERALREHYSDRKSAAAGDV